MLTDNPRLSIALSPAAITDADLRGALADLLLALDASEASLRALGETPERGYSPWLVDAIAEAHGALENRDHRVFSRLAELKRKEPQEDTLARNCALVVGQHFLTAFYGADDEKKVG